MSNRPSSKKVDRYARILEYIFQQHYRPGCDSFEFQREEIERAAKHLKIDPPKNFGDVLYSFRYRKDMPSSISKTATDGRQWAIEGTGPGRYRMRLRNPSRIVPNPSYSRIKIPDATPELVAAHALGDEQALLARVRYNRLIDIFLGVAAYSLQNHLRTSVPNIGQIETDEIYVAVDSAGVQFVIPVQAKGGNDQIADIQVDQDLALCRKNFPGLIPRPVAVQFLQDEEREVVVMFELVQEDGEIRVQRERHYLLVEANDISTEDLKRYATGV